ncbi:MAG: lipoate--protein ligase family protein [Treponema sp.]|jgi:lipoate-protein ligase A|nr:lipoate--protein ligase family protein [Treponema sp.]
MDRYPFRLLQTGFRNGFYNMGLDEAILQKSAEGGSPPTLRLYGWEPAAVSVGYFQGLEEEVDLEACALRGIDVVRRISGGGAVFHKAELTYSLIMPVSHPLAGAAVQGSYERFCAGIVRALALLGVEARFAPVNDILAGGRKISGNAQTRRMGCVLQHGTILLDLDLDLMFRLLRVPPEKTRGRLIAGVKNRVTSLRALRPAVSFDEAASALAEGFGEVLSLDFVREEAPTPEEEAAALDLAANKFGSRDWLRRR